MPPLSAHTRGVRMKMGMDGNWVPKGLTNLSLLSVTSFHVWHNFTCQPTSFSRSDHSSAPNTTVVSSSDGNEHSFGEASSSWPLAGSPPLQLPPTLGQSAHPVLSFPLPIHMSQLLGLLHVYLTQFWAFSFLALYSLGQCNLSCRFLQCGILNLFWIFY